ncbi:MAG: hypothetical protein RR672_03195, partial [Raoultibacter sp.]
MSEENRPEGMGAPLPPEQYPPVQQPNEPEKRHVHHSYIWLGTLQVSFSLFVAFFIMIFFTILRDEPISVGGQNIGSTAVFGIGA